MFGNLSQSSPFDGILMDARNERPLVIAFATIIAVWARSRRGIDARLVSHLTLDRARGLLTLKQNADMSDIQSCGRLSIGQPPAQQGCYLECRFSGFDVGCAAMAEGVFRTLRAPLP
jgi:hypothetical protein